MGFKKGNIMLESLFETDPVGREIKRRLLAYDKIREIVSNALSNPNTEDDDYAALEVFEAAIEQIDAAMKENLPGADAA